MAKGYRVLSRLQNGQVDIFTREPPGESRFVLFQGHPEYDPGTLGREYLRDMARFLSGREWTKVLQVPENYFDRATEGRLAELQDRDESDLAALQRDRDQRPAGPGLARQYACGSSPTG